MPSLIAITRKRTIETYRIVVCRTGLSSGSFIFNIQITNGIMSSILKIVMRVAQFSIIDY